MEAHFRHRIAKAFKSQRTVLLKHCHFGWTRALALTHTDTHTLRGIHLDVDFIRKRISKETSWWWWNGSKAIIRNRVKLNVYEPDLSNAKCVIASSYFVQIDRMWDCPQREKYMRWNGVKTLTQTQTEDKACYSNGINMQSAKMQTKETNHPNRLGRNKKSRKRTLRMQP